MIKQTEQRQSFYKVQKKYTFLGLAQEWQNVYGLIMYLYFYLFIHTVNHIYTEKCYKTLNVNKHDARRVHFTELSVRTNRAGMSSQCLLYEMKLCLYSVVYLCSLIILN